MGTRSGASPSGSPAPDELWAPTRDAKIVAVQVGYFAPLGCLRAESVSTWGVWFRELMEGLATESMRLSIGAAPNEASSRPRVMGSRGCYAAPSA